MNSDKCHKRKTLIQRNMSVLEVAEDHFRCHRWFHCGPSCCGPCPFCESEEE